MSIEPSTQSSAPNLKRAILGGSASLALFALARLAAGFLCPIGSYPYANLALFLGTPFLLISFVIPGASSLGLAAAMTINAVFWIMLGALLALMIRKPILATAAWLLVAGGLAGTAFALIILGMISSSP